MAPVDEPVFSGAKSKSAGIRGWKVIVLGVLALGIIGVVLVRDRARGRGGPAAAAAVGAEKGAAAGRTVSGKSPGGVSTPAKGRPAAGRVPLSKHLPRLLDLGSVSCLACKMMEPVLAEMGREYRGRLDVEFIDVWKNPAAGKKYGIKLIPTQIFFASDGRELWRHTGFISKDDIVAKWKELGVDLGVRRERSQP